MVKEGKAQWPSPFPDHEDLLKFLTPANYAAEINLVRAEVERWVVKSRDLKKSEPGAVATGLFRFSEALNDS